MIRKTMYRNAMYDPAGCASVYPYYCLVRMTMRPCKGWHDAYLLAKSLEEIWGAE